MTHDCRDHGELRTRWGPRVRRWGATLTAVGVAVVLTSCSSGTTPKALVATTTATSAPATGAVTAKPSMSISERLYADYNEKLTPAQKEKRVALSPDNVVVNSDGKITEDFIIAATEVTGPDGKIDPGKFAEAWASRQQALVTAGSTLKEWDHRPGGLSEYNLDTCKEIANKYLPVMGQAVYGHDLEDKATTANFCFRFATVANAKTKQGQIAKAIESYRYRVIPVKDTTPDITPNSDGSFKIDLREQVFDNWDEKGFQEVVGVLHAQLFAEIDWKLTVNVNKAANRVMVLESDSTEL